MSKAFLWQRMTSILKRSKSDSLPDEEDKAIPHSRRAGQWIMAAGGLLVLLVLAYVSVSLSTRSGTEDMQQVDAPGDLKSHSISAPGAGVSDRDIWITKSESIMQNMSNEMRKLKQKILTLQNEQKKRKKQPSYTSITPIMPPSVNTNGLPAMPPKPVNAPAFIPKMGPFASKTTPGITPITPPPAGASTPLPAQGQAGSQQPPQAPPPDNGILIVHLTPPPPPPKKDKKKEDKAAWLSISFTPATLLNGLDAATGGQAQQNPQPVLMEVSDMTQMPNRYQQNFKECFITAAGYGDISSERAYLRLEKLSCIDEDGHSIEETIDGYITGEDGKVGMKGRLVSKQGQVLAKALLAGLASGIGTAFTQSLRTQSISPLGATSTFPPSTAFRSGIYSGVGKALNRLADFYIKQAQKLYPVIEVDAGRSVDVIINKGIRLTGWNK